MRRCEVDRLEVDFPCYGKAYGYLKFGSHELGEKEKGKVWLCKKHFQAIDDEGILTMIFSKIDRVRGETSLKYRARMNKIR